MLRFHTASEALRGLNPDGPVALARPDRAAAAASWFLDRFPGEVLYAVKANPSPWLLDALYGAGVRWFDVASEGEVRLIGDRFPDATLAFMHPVKSRRAIRVAYREYGCRIFVTDTVEELEKILEETGNARDLTLVVRIAVSNDGASLPLKAKFGASGDAAVELLKRARAATEENLGVSFHVGSQCMTPASYRAAMGEAARLIVQAGVTVDVIDVGGGFPVAYPGMTPPPLQSYVDEIARVFDSMPVTFNCQLWCEPGRALCAEATAILARVELRKGDALYLNDGSYGNLFDATHVAWPYPVRALRLDGPFRAKNAPFRFYGPTCDSIDAADGPFQLPADMDEGDWVEIDMLGAYGVAMATRFNGFGETVTAICEEAPAVSVFPLPVRAAKG